MEVDSNGIAGRIGVKLDGREAKGISGTSGIDEGHNKLAGERTNDKDKNEQERKLTAGPEREEAIQQVKTSTKTLQRQAPRQYSQYPKRF